MVCEQDDETKFIQFQPFKKKMEGNSQLIREDIQWELDECFIDYTIQSQVWDQHTTSFEGCLDGHANVDMEDTKFFKEFL